MTQMFREEKSGGMIFLYPHNMRIARKFQYSISRDENEWVVRRRGEPQPIGFATDRWSAVQVAEQDWLEVNGHLNTGRDLNDKVVQRLGVKSMPSK